jgi:hypothetical protein
MNKKLVAILSHIKENYLNVNIVDICNLHVYCEDPRSSFQEATEASVQRFYTVRLIFGQTYVGGKYFKSLSINSF